MTPRTRTLALVLAPVWAVLGFVVWAQTPSPSGTAPAAPATRKFCTRRTAFRIPFRIDEQEKKSLKEVQLYVRKGAGDAWALKESVSPTETEFSYRVNGDGEYWFSIIRVDRAGHMTPANLNGEAPNLIVIVDTQPPEVDLAPVLGPSGESYLKCELHDLNPDYASVKMEYQTVDKSWKTLAAVADQPGVFRVPDPSILGSRLKISASDLAGNTVTREMNQQAAVALPPLAEAALAEPVTSRSNKVIPPPMPVATPVATGKPTEQPAPTPIAEPAPVAPAKPVETAATTSQRQSINNTHALLEYQLEQVGPSGIGKIELWFTADEGQTWKKLCDDPDRRSPVEFDLPGEGVYGLSLVVSNGRGVGGNPPAKGDAPDWVVEVDTTPPAGKLQPAVAGVGTDEGTLMIAWTAVDKNLGPAPIDLYYAVRPEGPWLPIAKNVKNEGKYRWTMPKDLETAFFLRMDVTDLAGNRSRFEAPQTVVVDRSQPKARVLGIAAGALRATAPAGN